MNSIHYVHVGSPLSRRVALPLKGLASSQRPEWRDRQYADDEDVHGRAAARSISRDSSPERPPSRYPSPRGMFTRERCSRPNRSPSPSTPILNCNAFPFSERSVSPYRGSYRRTTAPPLERLRSPLSRIASPIGARPTNPNQMWRFGPVVEDPDDDMPQPNLPMRADVRPLPGGSIRLSIDTREGLLRRCDSPISRSQFSQTPASPISAALERNHLQVQAAEIQHRALCKAVNMTKQLRCSPAQIRELEASPRSRGSFGEVWYCEYKSSPYARQRPVAVKHIYLRPQDQNASHELLRCLLREVVAWHELVHPNISRFIGYVFESDSAKMISDWQAYGNVLQYLQRYPEASRIALLADAASGLGYLHGRIPTAVIHGDIKPENILVDASGTAKLTDFGLSIILDDTVVSALRTSDQFRGTMPYADPILLKDGPRTVSTDLWALGWVIFELTTSIKPYPHLKSRHALYTSLLTQPPLLPTRSTFHDLPHARSLWPLLESCWSSDPSKRMPARVISSCLQKLRTTKHL